MECKNCRENWGNKQREGVLISPINGFYVENEIIILCPYCSRLSRSNVIRLLETRSKILTDIVDSLRKHYNII
jgi:hypothetical protein